MLLQQLLTSKRVAALNLHMTEAYFALRKNLVNISDPVVGQHPATARLVAVLNMPMVNHFRSIMSICKHRVRAR